MKILLVGANGQLGTEIYKHMESDNAKNQIITATSKYLNIKDIDKVVSTVKSLKPNIIINCAAYNNVDACENNEEEAFKVNSLGPRNLAMAAEKVKAKIVHLSTDYVFSGDKQNPYKEYDKPNPINTYGKSKYIGEEYVKSFCDQYYIIRTSWLYGLYGNNFFKKIVNIAKGNQQIQVVDDQIGSPTCTEELAQHIYKIISTEEYGIYHCSGNEQCSWYEYASEIIRLLNIQCDVLPVISQKNIAKAERPSYSYLDNMMLRCTVGDNMQYWKESLKSFVNKHYEK